MKTTVECERKSPTPAQLHRLACIDCGSTTGPFVPAGHTYTRDREGGRLGWSVVACASHGSGSC